MIYFVCVHLLRLVVLTHLEVRVLVMGTPVGLFDGAVYPVIEIGSAFLREQILRWLFVHDLRNQSFFKFVMLWHKI